MQRYDWSSTSPKEPMLHLSLSPCTGYQLAARIKLKILMLAHRTTTGSATAYFHSLIWIYIPSRSLRSDNEQRLVVHHHREAQNHSPEHSRSPFLAGGMNFPPPSECWIPVNLQATTENSSLSTLLDFIIKKKINLYLFLLLLACTYLNNVWDLVLRALPLSVCLFKMNRFMYSPIVSRFG